MQLGGKAQRQLKKLASVWEQGQHLVISGATGSGKTALGRHIDQIRLDKGGFVVVFVAKLRDDQTILNDYKGWTRWTKWKKNPSPHENRVLLYPDTSKAKTLKEARDIQRDVFGEAINALGRDGKWTVDFDEGLYMCDPSFMGFADEIKMLHALGRSSNLTIITKMQRPSNVPLLIYGSASHAFIGRTREQADLKRLAELGGRATSKEMQGRISQLGRHDFLWIPVAPDWEPQIVNLRK
jgi:energy-coupling factor transporter ATP-binding protein EcfA2